MADERTLWQPGGPSDASLLEEPSDPEKEWDPGELPPAEWENWFKRQVTLDMQEIAEAILLDAGSNSGSLSVPVEIGDTRHSRIYTEVSGAGDIAIAFNAKYDDTNDEWLEHDSNANNPFLMVFNPSLSGITGISSSDLENENGLHLFEAASISSSVITWQLADIGLDRVDSVNIDSTNYLEPGGGVISNNSSNPNTQIDNTSIKLWVRDFSGGGRIVELPARSPAFDITVSGFNGTTGGLINGSSRNATDWYEFAVIASSTDDTLDPIVVGYTIDSTDNTPQSASDLPGNYDLFRPMGSPGLTWLIRLDASQNIYGFEHNSDGWVVWDGDTINDFSTLITGATGSGSFLVTPHSSPKKTDVIAQTIGIETSTATDSGYLTFANHSLSQIDGGIIRFYVDENTDWNLTSSVYRGAKETVYYYSSPTATDVRWEKISAFKAVGK